MTRRFCLLVLALLASTGCGSFPRTVNRTLIRPDSAGSLAAPTPTSPFLKAHLKSGEVALFSAWSVDSSAGVVSGTALRQDINRRLVRGDGPVRIALDSVALFETNTIASHGSVVAMAIMTGVSIGMTVYCIQNPKACFGSCPTFYVKDAGTDRLVAEGFSSSVSPALEATDLDAIAEVEAGQRTFALEMRDEALETHNVRWADLLVVPHAEGEAVIADRTGRFLRTGPWAAPEQCRAPEGDCQLAVAARDARERFSGADSTDLAAREVVELTFERPQGRAGPTALVLGSRQTLLSTFLFYQELAYMGREAGSWFAALERGVPNARASALGIDHALGRIEVEVEGADGAWHPAGEVGESGPLASDVQSLVLPPLGSGPVRVRLRMARGLWRLDLVALAPVLGEATALRVRPTRVRRAGTDDGEALGRLTDDARFLTTLPGDALTLEYALPVPERRRAIFLESRGYYLEWMRDEWLADESAERAMMMMSDPARALRELAPAFKRTEAQMEAAFWRSRYVAR